MFTPRSPLHQGEHNYHEDNGELDPNDPTSSLDQNHSDQDFIDPNDDGINLNLNNDNDEEDNNNTNNSNVRVIVRVRPLLPNELESQSSEIGQHNTNLLRIQQQIIQANPAFFQSSAYSSSPSSSSTSISLAVKDSVQHFSFDSILSPSSSQLDVYNNGKVDRMLHALMKGYHGTIFAYGQTVSHLL